MIVNNQVFSYRLVIASLIIGIVILVSFSYISYDTLKKNEIFIEQEKALVESELSEMISSYEAIDVKSRFIAKQLVNANAEILKLLDSVKLIKTDASLVSKYRSQIKTLKRENLQLLIFAEDFTAENSSLNQQTKVITNHLTEAKTISNVLNTKNETVTQISLDLKESLEKTKQLTIKSVVAKGVKRVTISKRVVVTKNVNKTNKFQVCFTLVKNELLEKGAKEFYVQVLDSKMNVVADKGTLNFGKTSLIYSAKETVDYNGEDLDVCSLIDKGMETLTKGAYFISVFYQGNKLGRTTIELK